jgi:hypothetical protein
LAALRSEDAAAPNRFLCHLFVEQLQSPSIIWYWAFEWGVGLGDSKVYADVDKGLLEFWSDSLPGLARGDDEGKVARRIEVDTQQSAFDDERGRFIRKNPVVTKNGPRYRKRGPEIVLVASKNGESAGSCLDFGVGAKMGVLFHPVISSYNCPQVNEND